MKSAIYTSHTHRSCDSDGLGVDIGGSFVSEVESDLLQQAAEVLGRGRLVAEERHLVRYERVGRYVEGHSMEKL
jgi:hypothetical protein